MNYVQNSFASGEFSPSLRGRSDIDQYAAGTDTLENFIVEPHGPVSRRPGTVFYHDMGSSDVGSVSKAKWNVIPFTPSRDESFQIVITEDRLFVMEDGVPISDTHGIDIWVSPSVVFLVSDWHPQFNEQLYGPVQFTTTISLPTGILANTDYWLDKRPGLSTDFDIYSDADRTTLVNFVNDEAGSHSVNRDALIYATDIPSADVESIGYAQQQKALYIRANGASEAMRLELLESGRFHYTAPGDVLWVNGPWETSNSDDVMLSLTAFSTTPLAVGDTVTVTASSLTSVALTNYFQASDADRFIRVVSLGTDDGVGVIKLPAVVAAGNSVALCTVERTFQAAATAPIDSIDFNFGLAWSATNQPTEMAFAEGRLWQAGEPERPSVVVGSKTLQYENYSLSDDDGTVQQTSALDLAVLSKRTANVQWIEGGLGTVLVGTDQGVFAIRSPSNQYGASANLGITPTSVEVTKAIGERAGDVRPVLVGPTLLFTSLSRRRLYGVEYEFTSDRFEAKDLSILVPHLAEKGIKEIEYAQDHDKAVWIRHDDGSMSSMAFDRSQQLLGWSQHSISGVDAEVMAMTITPGATQDDVWMVVQRTINSVTTHYFERFSDKFDDATDIEDAVFLDSAATTASPGPSPILAPHLVGETVRLLVDGADVGTGVVDANGRVFTDGVELGADSATVSVGLAYESRLKTLPVVVNDADGTTFGRHIAIGETTFMFVNSSGGEYGTDFDNMDAFTFRTVEDLMDAPVPLYTGRKSVNLPGGSGRDNGVTLRNASALPMTLTSISYPITVGSP